MGHVDSVVFFLWKFFIRVTQVTWVTPVTFDTFEPYHEPHIKLDSELELKSGGFESLFQTQMLNFCIVDAAAAAYFSSSV